MRFRANKTSDGKWAVHNGTKKKFSLEHAPVGSIVRDGLTEKQAQNLANTLNRAAKREPYPPETERQQTFSATVQYTFTWYCNDEETMEAAKEQKDLERHLKHELNKVGRMGFDVGTEKLHSLTVKVEKLNDTMVPYKEW